jgi:methylmalonyl-CoA/ethylmalonyl-CoA epimerase
MSAELFRAELGEPHHLAYVVDDIEATVGRLAAAMGAGPFFLFEDAPVEDVRSGEGPAEFVHNSAFGRCGDGAIELIEPVRLAPEPVARGFDAPRPRLQHVAYVIAPDAVEELRGDLDGNGFSRYLSARMGEIEMTYHDARAVLGHDLEIHRDCQTLRDNFAQVLGAADGWDGSEPLRRIEG